MVPQISLEFSFSKDSSVHVGPPGVTLTPVSTHLISTGVSVFRISCIAWAIVLFLPGCAPQLFVFIANLQMYQIVTIYNIVEDTKDKQDQAPSFKKLIREKDLYKRWAQVDVQ